MLDEKTLTLVDNGNELTFRLRRMSATATERWILRAGLALFKTGLVDEMSAPVQGMDAQGILSTGLSAVKKQGFSLLGRLDPDTVLELSYELLKPCYQVVRNELKPLSKDTINAVVSDFRTILTLKKEAFLLNFGFFFDASHSDSETSEPVEDAPTRGRKRSISPRSSASS